MATRSRLSSLAFSLFLFYVVYLVRKVQAHDRSDTNLTHGSGRVDHYSADYDQSAKNKVEVTPPFFGIHEAGVVHRNLNATLSPLRSAKPGFSVAQSGCVFAVIVAALFATLVISLAFFVCARYYARAIYCSDRYIPV